MPELKNRGELNSGFMQLLGLLLLLSLRFVIAVIAGRGTKSVMEARSGVPGPPGGIMNAPAGIPRGGNLMVAPSGNPGPGSVAPTADRKPKPPQSVVDYLNFVKRVEEHRQMLLKDTAVAMGFAQSGQMQGLLAMVQAAMDPDSESARDPLAESKKELLRQYKNWLNTLEYFDRRPAPEECREFSGAYRDVLFKETKAIGEIAIALSNVNLMDPQDLSKLLASLQKMKSDPTIQASIDKAADDADAKLAKLVSKYDMEKPFDVPREQRTSGSIMGF